MSRTENLPTFGNAPLNEVVCGIQFMPVRGYQQIFAGEVWNLFRADYPHVEEQPALQPSFEVFGGPPAAQFDFGLVTGATHDRFWFLAPDKHEIIQFQNDRLLHNWRKIEGAGEYPLFPAILNKFSQEAETLEKYFIKNFMQGLAVNQCEVSYTNHIPIWRFEDKRPDAWLKFLNTGHHQIDDFSMNFRRTIRRPGNPHAGRLYCQAGSGLDGSGRAIIALVLTARGVPSEPNLSGALEFLRESREMLVELFAEVTTDSAHMVWERLR